MKAIICYKSYFGSVEKYARWLSKEIGADLLKFRDVKNNSFEPYDIVVISSGTYIGHMPFVKFIKRKWPQIKDKKVVVTAIGAAAPDDEWSIRSYKKIPNEIRKHIKYFKLPGETPGSKGSPKSSVVNKKFLGPVIDAINMLRR